MNQPRLETRLVATLKAHPDSVRTADSVDELRLRRSADRWGWLRPPVVVNDRTGHVLDGDRLLSVAKQRGDTTVPCWVVDVPEVEEDAVHLALQNHVGDWLWEPVSVKLKEMKVAGLDVGLSGFHDRDTGPLTEATWKKPVKGDLKAAEQDDGQGGFAWT